MLLACDQYEDVTRLAWRTETGELQTAEENTSEKVLWRIQELGEQVEKIVLAQESPLRQKLSTIGKPYEQHSRLEAVYRQFRDQLNGDDCVILSLGRASCTGGVVKNGQVFGERKGENTLGLYALLAEWWTKDPGLLQGLESIFGEQSTAERKESVLLEFGQALLGKNNRLPVRLPLNLPIAAGSKIADWKERMYLFLEQLHSYQEMGTLICTNWAATGSLGDLFKEKYQVVLTSDKPFEDAARGLLLLGQYKGKVPHKPTKILERDPQLQEYEQEAEKLLTEGKYDEALVYLASLRGLEPENSKARLLMGLTEALEAEKAQGVQTSKELEQLKEVVDQSTSTRSALEKELNEKTETIAALEKKVKKPRTLAALLAVGIIAGFGLWGGSREPIDQKQFEESKVLIQNLKETIKQKEQQIDSLASERTSQESPRQTQETSTLNTQFQEKTAQVVSLTETVNTQQEKIAFLEEALNKASTDGESSEEGTADEISGLKEALDQKTKTVDDLTKAQQSSQETIERLQSNLANAQNFFSDGRQYRILHTTDVYALDGFRGEKLGELRRGRIVKAAGVREEWLLIESDRGNPPGYIPIEAAELVDE